MKLSSLCHSRRTLLTFLLSIIVCVGALDPLFPSHLCVFASETTVVAVDPSIYIANPGDLLSVNVSASNVEDLFSYQVCLWFDSDIIEAMYATEGPFLKDGTTSPLGTFFTYQIHKEVQGTFVVVACVTMGCYPGVNGGGTLFTVDFIVQDGGISDLHLSDTFLLDSNGAEISHISSDGSFHTTVPRAQFTFTTEYPVTGENVTFDASSSYDPDGTIISYLWNFGDGITGTGMLSFHSYTEEGSYLVTLQVIDNDGLSDGETKQIYPRAPLWAYISVPYHRQKSSYYCGPAALEMAFDFYGPDISQREIADVARTAPDGTYTCDMIRAAHFSDLSSSVGMEMPGSIKGYTTRKLGYAAFECGGMTIDQLKSLISDGYPVIVLVTWHYLVAVGYSSTRIVFQDSNFGENHTMTYEEFETTWDYSGHWGLFVCPWIVEISIPDEVMSGSIFNITASITYPWHPPFPTYQYPASLSNATVTLPPGLSLVSGETAKKTLGTGIIEVGASADAIWTVRADNIGAYTINVEAEGKVEGFVPPLPSYPDSYSYEDRIGGFIQGVFHVVAPPSNPKEIITEMMETIESWRLPAGTDNSLTSKLDGALRVLNLGNEYGTVRILKIFMRRVEALQEIKLTREQAEYLVSEAQRVLELLKDRPQ